MPRLTKKTAPVAVVAPVAVAPVADEEPEEVAEHLCSTCGEMVDVIGETECEKCQTPPVVADDEPSEDEEEEEEEEDPVVAMLRKQEQTLTEQKLSNITKHFYRIEGMVKAIEEKEAEHREQIRVLVEAKNKLRIDAERNASEENKAVLQKLDKVKATIATYLGQKVKKTAERKSSGEVVKAKSSTFFSRKALNEMVNQDTRFIYEQKKGCVFKRFCYVSKSENRVYECDENGTTKGLGFKSLNDFCVSVKKSVNYQGSLKQDTSVVLKYYDISSGEYKSFKDLTSPLN
jgi:Asp-tRNA(Asn)/Glu-tRNA(Gln) amidotransferase C subunit